MQITMQIELSNDVEVSNEATTFAYGARRRHWGSPQLSEVTASETEFGLFQCLWRLCVNDHAHAHAFRAALTRVLTRTSHGDLL